MSKFHIGTIEDAQFSVPAPYAEHADGYRSIGLINHLTSPACVHMGVDLVEIAPGGCHMRVLHAFEKGFYVLSGELIVGLHGTGHRLSAGHYGLIHKATPYTFFNPGDEPVRIFEMNAPQPKPFEHNFKDTVFQPGKVIKLGIEPDLIDPRVKFLGKFEDSQMAGDGDTISAAGARSSSIHGIILKEFIDRMFGAFHLALFMVQFQPGGAGTTHDHPHEEIYYFLSGQACATLEDQEFIVGAGQYVWTGAGCFHQFECYGDEPVRWIETQAPLPADFEAFRFRQEWDRLTA